jgi:hypothetical protein
MKQKLHIHLIAFRKACKVGLVVFVGTAGVVGMAFIYAPEEIITTIYLAAMYCGIASAIINYLGVIMCSTKPCGQENQ